VRARGRAGKMGGMSDVTEALRLIANIVRTGTVFAIDLAAQPPAVRVQDGAWESGWLQWVELRAGTTKTWNPPSLGEQVIALCPGGDTAAGYALTSLNSDANPAPSTSGDEHLTIYPDGARVAYNHATGALTATGIKSGLIDASTQIVLRAPEIVLDGKTTVTDLLSYLAGLSGRDGKGNTTAITGNITHKDGDLSSNGVVLHRHDHGGVIRGGDRTEPPRAAEGQ